jgi:hypothetical protein
MSERTDKRTTVSLAEVVWQMAESQMAEKGFNDNFSAYCADLIRRDRERSANPPASSSFGVAFDAPTATARQPVTYKKARKPRP